MQAVLKGNFSDSDKKTAENFGIDYMDVSEFVNIYGKGVLIWGLKMEQS